MEARSGGREVLDLKKLSKRQKSYCLFLVFSSIQQMRNTSLCYRWSFNFSGSRWFWASLLFFWPKQKDLIWSVENDRRPFILKSAFSWNVTVWVVHSSPPLTESCKYWRVGRLYCCHFMNTQQSVAPKSDVIFRITHFISFPRVGATFQFGHFYETSCRMFPISASLSQEESSGWGQYLKTTISSKLVKKMSGFHYAWANMRWA